MRSMFKCVDRLGRIVYCRNCFGRSERDVDVYPYTWNAKISQRHNICRNQVAAYVERLEVCSGGR